MLLRPYRVLIRFIPLFAVLIAASQVTAQQKAPIPPASPKSEDRDTSAAKPLATGESTHSPPAENAASSSSGPPWVELSDFAMRQEGLGSVFSVNYRLVEGTPEPGAQYVWIVAQPLGVVVRYIDEPVNLGRKQGSLEMRAASFVMGMGSVQTYMAKRLPSFRRIPFGNEEFEKISEVVTLGQASRPARSGSASDAMRAKQEAAARPAPPSRETVQQWLETLQEGDRAARETAAKSLASSAQADCTAALVKALDDESPVVRSAMLQALERLKASETATAIARRLADDADRTAACRALKQIGASAAPAVLPYVDHERAPVRQAACELLEAAKLDRAAATSTLGKLLGRLDDDEAVRSAAILAIRRQVASAAGLEPGTAATDPGVPERLLKVLAGGLASPSVPGRVWALRLVAVLGKPAQGLSAHVAKLLDDPSAEVRELAADTLLLIRQSGKQTPSGKDRQAGPATVTEMPANLTSGLVRLLEDSDPAMRYWTARLIGALGVGGKSAIPALVRLCDDPDTAVRCAAVQAVQDLCTAICDGRALLLARVREMAEQINALGQGSQSRALELSKDLLAGLERIWPVAADCQFAQGSRGRQSTTGPNSAEWFGYGGAGDWKEFAVLPDQPFLLSTRGDGQMIGSIRFTISENEGGTWVVKQTIQGPTSFDGYRWYVHTPSSDRLRITAQGWFYLYLYQLQGASGCGKEEAAQEDTSAGGFREWVKNPEYKRQVTEAAAAREQQRRALQVPEDISDDEIRAMVQRLFLPEDDDFNYERLKLVGAKAAPFLREALNDSRVVRRFDKEVWYRRAYPLPLICGLLEPIDPQTVVRHLTSYVGHEDSRVRQCAASFLGEIGSAECIEPVLKLLDDEDDDVRSRAMNGILEGVKTDRCEKRFLDAVFAAVAKLLNRKTTSIFGEAPQLLLAIDAERAFPILLSAEYFSTDNPELHSILDKLNLAGRKIPREKLLPLLEQLEPRSGEYPHSYQYAEALRAYALNPDASAEQKLRAALRSSEETVQEAAAEGLGILTGLADPFQFVVQVLKKKGFDGLSEPQKWYYAVYLYDSEVCNGGHAQYFVNSSGEHWKTALSGLGKIGAKERAGILQEAANLFGDDGPAVDNDRRHRQLAQFSEKQDEVLEKLDSRYYACKENVQVLLYLYAIDNKDEFRSRPSAAKLR